MFPISPIQGIRKTLVYLPCSPRPGARPPGRCFMYRSLTSRRFPSAPQLLCTGVMVSEHFPGQTFQSTSLHLQKRPNRQDHSTKIASSGIFTSPLLLPHLPVASFLPHLPSSLRLHAFSKMQKTLGPFAQKILKLPAGTPRRPTCSIHWFLPVKAALRLKSLSLIHI